MWKGLSWLMLLYGLLVTAAAMDVGDKQKGMAAMFGSWMQNYTEMKERAAADGIAPPHIARFDGVQPWAAVSEGASLELQDDGSNAWLDWTPRRGSSPIDLLGILLSPGPPDANGLALRIRANYDGQIVVGVMEEDGSSYNIFPEPLELQWTQYEFPLDGLTLSDDSEDENGQLDVEQVDTVLLAYLDMQDGVVRDAETRVISVDDVHFRLIRDNPLFPDFDGPGGGAGNGMDDPPPDGQMPRERMKGRLKERIKDRMDGGE
jgi:hypothetical protein